jgi:hypothetical protein
VKDSITADLESQIRNLERELSAKSMPIEITVPKIEYDKLDQELQSTRKRVDGLMIEVMIKIFFQSIFAF